LEFIRVSRERVGFDRKFFSKKYEGIKFLPQASLMFAEVVTGVKHGGCVYVSDYFIEYGRA
jgi:hypothetical protein